MKKFAITLTILMVFAGGVSAQTVDWEADLDEDAQFSPADGPGTAVSIELDGSAFSTGNHHITIEGRRFNATKLAGRLKGVWARKMGSTDAAVRMMVNFPNPAVKITPRQVGSDYSARILWDGSEIIRLTATKVYMKWSAIRSVAAALIEASKPPPRGDLCGFITGKKGDFSVITGDAAWDFIANQVPALKYVREGVYSSLGWAIMFVMDDLAQCVLKEYRDNPSGDDLWVWIPTG